MSFKVSAIAAAVFTFLVTACGGGAEPATPVTPTASSGTAVDGYISFAKVTCDSNDNGIADSAEPFVYTLDNGRYTFVNGCAHGVILVGGTSTDTKQPFIGLLKAPAGASFTTPLTTLISAGMSPTQVASALGLANGTDVTQVDPAAATAGGALVNADLYKKTLATQYLFQKTTEIFAALGSTNGSAALQSVYDGHRCCGDDSTVGH